ncbi:hypothetical protein [uncultured Treponema sp.]|uniref:hypothetical protein n=1 Tax=uncultured Treponema sp. TaxID=162155 RepID=UPI0025FA63C1|nr:hypothetical protein [uncultured Treponema sp.]
MDIRKSMLVVNYSHDNYENLIESLDFYNKASDTIICDSKIEKTGFVIFINSSCAIENVAKYKIGRRRIATQKNSVKFSCKKNLKHKIEIAEFQFAFPKFESEIREINFFTTIKSLTPDFEKTLIAFILKKNPDLIEYFKSVKFYKEINFKNIPQLENEFDAISIPLKMIGVNEVSFTANEVSENEPLLKTIYFPDMTEDQMIVQDQVVFMSEKFQSENFFISKTFKNNINGKSAIVFYANRASLEKAIGVDLILYNSEYKSYLFIQYKRMKKENGNFVYRFDKQLDSEIFRMKTMFEKTVKATDSRLNSNPFYLKFCPSNQSELLSGDLQLIKGIILPLHSFFYFREKGLFVGKRNGELLSFKNVPQYMDNTIFINLYKNGWIGSSEIDKESIEQYIKEQLGKKYSVIAAQIL